MKAMSYLNKTLLIIFISVLSSVLQAGNKIVYVEDAIEEQPRVFFLGKNLSGVVRGKKCEACEEIKLDITPETRAFLDHKEVSLKDFVSTMSKPVLTIYNIKSKKVTRLYWKTKK